MIEIEYVRLMRSFLEKNVMIQLSSYIHDISSYTTTATNYMYTYKGD